MRKAINAHCHIYPAKIAARAVEGIKNFYDLDMMTLNGMTDDLVRDGSQVGCVHYLVHSVATVPAQVNSINNFIAEEVNTHPGVFTGFGTLHPDSETLEQDLDNLVKLGLKGVKLHPDFQGFSLDEERGLRLGELISKVNIPVMIHCGDPRNNFSNPKQLKIFLEANPNLTVIGAHLGGWSMWDDALKFLPGHDNLYVDCSSCFGFMSATDAVNLIRAYGVDRVIWGTDYPMWEAPIEMDLFEKLDLTEEERQMILYDNAAKLLGLDN